MIEIISISVMVLVLALKIVHELGKSIRIKQLSKLSVDEIDAITKLETALKSK